MRVTVKNHEKNGTPASLQLEWKAQRDDCNTLVMVRKANRAPDGRHDISFLQHSDEHADLDFERIINHCIMCVIAILAAARALDVVLLETWSLQCGQGSAKEIGGREVKRPPGRPKNP